MGLYLVKIERWGKEDVKYEMKRNPSWLQNSNQEGKRKEKENPTIERWSFGCTKNDLDPMKKQN